ncbi:MULTISPECIES: ABC transporter permease [Streptomyces]|uniref:Transport permease protein n=1 Tax=Streptomyces alboniger TaxID=132473 RepID=A0A5J6HKM4_STRAD|nr:MULTISPECIES: ABC transporter permease [Streptomyces]QEV20776.1 ABC transporter permease [Streptomyces alboniger]
MHYLKQTRLIFIRSTRPWARSPLQLIVGISGPLVYLVLFGPLLKNTLPGDVDAWQWFVPGMLMQLTLFGAAYAGFSLTPELRSGVMERLRVAPVSRAALLSGRVLSDLAQLGIQGVMLLAAATAFGFRAPLPAVVLLLALSSVLAAGISSASYALALILKQENRFAPLLSMVLVPLMLLSGVLLPMSAAPDWLYDLSRVNPLSHVVDALRAITAGEYASSTTLTGALAALSLVVIFGAWGMRTMNREQG